LSVNTFSPVRAALEKIMRTIIGSRWDPFHPHVFTPSEIKKICLSHNFVVVYETYIRENLPHVGDVTYQSTPKFETEFQRKLQNDELLIKELDEPEFSEDLKYQKNDKILNILKFLVTVLGGFIDKFTFNINSIFREYLVVVKRKR